MSRELFLNEVSKYVRNITKTEIEEIIFGMYQNGFNEKETANHILSVRSFLNNLKTSAFSY